MKNHLIAISALIVTNIVMVGVFWIIFAFLGPYSLPFITVCVLILLGLLVYAGRELGVFWPEDEEEEE